MGQQAWGDDTSLSITFCIAYIYNYKNVSPSHKNNFSYSAMDNGIQVMTNEPNYIINEAISHIEGMGKTRNNLSNFGKQHFEYIL